MGSSLFSRRVRSLAAFILGLGSFALLCHADQIVKTDGSVVNGQITGISSGQIQVTIGTGHSIVYLSDVKTVDMAPPAVMTSLKGATPAAAVAALEPLVKQYAGLPSDWVLDAMSQLADAYDAQGQSDKAAQVYAQVAQLYANTPYQKEAIAGQASVALKQGKVDAALAAVQPLIAEADKTIAPSPAEGRLYARAFLVYGEALEAQKQYPQALEAYLTVKTLFYQNPALAEQADQLAQKLRAQNPGVAVD